MRFDLFKREFILVPISINFNAVEIGAAPTTFQKRNVGQGEQSGKHPASRLSLL